MDSLGAPADAASCVAISIKLLDGLDEGVEGEIQGIYDMITEMANMDEMIAEQVPSLHPAPLHHHRTITAPSLHHHCTVTAPSL